MALWRRNDGVYVIRYYTNGRKGGKVQETLGKIPYSTAARIHKARVAAAASRAGTSGARATFDAIAAEYLATHGARMSASSFARARDVIERHLAPSFGSLFADSIRAVDVERYRERRLKAGAKPATVNREWAVLKAILNRAEAWELIERNPIRRGVVSLLPVDNQRLVYFEPEEWQRFITAFDDAAKWKTHIASVRRLGPVLPAHVANGERRFGAGRRPDSDASNEYLQRLRAIVPVIKALLFTGSRLREIVNLTWGDIDLRLGTIRIRQEKTSRVKTIPISTALRGVLSAQAPGVGAAQVFRMPNGSAVRAHEVQRAFAVAKRIADIRPQLTPHSLRHTFASWLAIKGVPLRTIQELLGHADIRMTIRYSHLSPAHLRDAVETIARMPGSELESESAAD